MSKTTLSRLWLFSLLSFLCLFLSSCSEQDYTPVFAVNQSDADAIISVYPAGGTSQNPLLQDILLAKGEVKNLSITSRLVSSGCVVVVRQTSGAAFSFLGSPLNPSGETFQFVLCSPDGILSVDVYQGTNFTARLSPMSESGGLSEQEIALQQLQNGLITQDQYNRMDFWLSFLGDNSRKRLLLFGRTDKNRYSSQGEAQSHITTVTVPVWKLSNGKKIPSSRTISINSALANDVYAIFTEIYNDPECFPIQELGGYSWRGDTSKSEHNAGMAIDINPTQNFQIKNGKILSGSYWRPDTDICSIRANSSVVRIFAAHGWSWGGNAWANGSTNYATGNHDYMHFSYLGK